MDEHTCYYCEKIKDLSEGEMVCEEFVCNDCEDKVVGDQTGYCSCECQLSGQCDQTC